MPWEEYRYVLYAREFGWTPQQVDEIPLIFEPWILPINSAITEAENYRIEKAQKEAEAKSRNG